MSKTVQFLIKQTFAPITEYTNSQLSLHLGYDNTSTLLTGVFQNFYNNIASNVPPYFIKILQIADDFKVRHCRHVRISHYFIKNYNSITEFEVTAKTQFRHHLQRCSRSEISVSIARESPQLPHKSSGYHGARWSKDNLLGWHPTWLSLATPHSTVF
jgi:hypothetical protein